MLVSIIGNQEKDIHYLRLREEIKTEKLKKIYQEISEVKKIFFGQKLLRD